MSRVLLCMSNFVFEGYSGVSVIQTVPACLLCSLQCCLLEGCFARGRRNNVCLD